MIKQLRLWLLRSWRWYRQRYLYIIADPKDNSITLSRALFDHMDIMSQEKAQVYVFSVVDCSLKQRLYAFTLNPDFETPAPLCDIQYNSKHRTIGFESLCPTVNRIFYDYGLPADSKVKLTVESERMPIGEGMIIYKILRPHDKHHR